MANWKTSKLLGKTFVDYQNRVVLKLGDRAWTAQELVDQLHIGNFVAAQRLTEKLTDKYPPMSFQKLTRHVSVDDLLNMSGVGETTIYVWMCALDYEGKNPMTWLDQKKEVTLNTMKRWTREPEKVGVKRAAGNKKGSV